MTSRDDDMDLEALKSAMDAATPGRRSRAPGREYRVGAKKFRDAPKDRGPGRVKALIVPIGGAFSKELLTC